LIDGACSEIQHGVARQIQSCGAAQIPIEMDVRCIPVRTPVNRAIKNCTVDARTVRATKSQNAQVALHKLPLGRTFAIDRAHDFSARK